MTLANAIAGVVQNATQRVMAAVEALDGLQASTDQQLENLYRDESGGAFESESAISESAGGVADVEPAVQEASQDESPQLVQDDQIVAETVAVADVVASAVEATIEEVPTTNEPPPLPASLLEEVPVPDSPLGVEDVPRVDASDVHDMPMADAADIEDVPLAADPMAAESDPEGEPEGADGSEDGDESMAVDGPEDGDESMAVDGPEDGDESMAVDGPDSGGGPVTDAADGVDDVALDAPAAQKPKNGTTDFTLVEEDPAHPDAGATVDAPQ